MIFYPLLVVFVNVYSIWVWDNGVPFPAVPLFVFGCDSIQHVTV